MSRDEDSSGWQLTESDPGVFTEFLKALGVPLIVDDLYSLDSDSLAALKPLHALFFLFKWRKTSDASLSAGEYDPDFSGFFAQQVVQNACATLAVLNAIGNIPSLSTGEQLAELNSFTAGMDPQTRGLVITNAEWLRAAHNALSPPNAITLDGQNLTGDKGDVYHFIVYMPVMGALYELDGLMPYPIRHGACDEHGDWWFRKAREVIEARIKTYPEGALDFNLLALRDDPLPRLQAQLEGAYKKSTATEELRTTIANENSKRRRWAFENSLRKHSHIGLVHALLFALAKAGSLPFVQKSSGDSAETDREREEKVMKCG